MVISKADTDSKSILSECEMIQEKPSGLKEWFGRGNKREPKGTDRTGKTYGLQIRDEVSGLAVRIRP